MAAKELEISNATAADLAADMEHHRETYAGFFNWIKYAIIGVSIVLAILFFTLN